MGFYCSTEIVDKNNKCLFRINTEKYGIGYGALCFNKEDYTVDISNHVYFLKTPVKKAKERVEKYYKEITAKKNKKILDGIEYDEWSEDAIQKAIDFMMRLLQVFDEYPTDYVYADLSEASYLYEADDEIPVSDGKDMLIFVHRVLDGCYIGRFPSEDLWEKAKSFIKQFKEGLLDFDGILGIENFGSSYDPTFFKLKNQTLMKFQMDIKLAEDSIQDDFNIFDAVMTPIRAYFLCHGCDYERNFVENWVTKYGKIRIIVYKIM